MLVAVELVGALLILGGTAFGALALFGQARAQRDIERANNRVDRIMEENLRVEQTMRDVANAVETTTTVVQLGTGVVRDSHAAIASIPFDVFDSIPATRRASRFLRGVHDVTAGGVYRAIGEVNKAIGGAFAQPRAEVEPQDEAVRLESSREEHDELHRAEPPPEQPLRVESERLNPDRELDR